MYESDLKICPFMVAECGMHIYPFCGKIYLRSEFLIPICHRHVAHSLVVFTMDRYVRSAQRSIETQIVNKRKSLKKKTANKKDLCL